MVCLGMQGASSIAGCWREDGNEEADDQEAARQTSWQANRWTGRQEDRLAVRRLDGRQILRQAGYSWQVGGQAIRKKIRVVRDGHGDR